MRRLPAAHGNAKQPVCAECYQYPASRWALVPSRGEYGIEYAVVAYCGNCAGEFRGKRLLCGEVLGGVVPTLKQALDELEKIRQPGLF